MRQTPIATQPKTYAQPLHCLDKTAQISYDGMVMDVLGGSDMQRVTNARIAQLLLCTAWLAATTAWADCVDTVRLSAQEKDFYLRANAVLKSLLRPAPQADKLRASDSVTDPGDIETCKADKKQGDFTVGVSRKYIWPDPKGNMADSVVTLNLAINATKFDTAATQYEGAFGSPSPTRSAGLKVYNVVWSLTGSSYGIAAQTETLRASLAEGLERDRMEKLVGRPLPSVAESDALAKKAASTRLLSSSVAPATTTAAPIAPNRTAVASPSAAPAAVAAVAAVPAAPSEPAAAPAPDTVKEVTDSIQKLRNLFGR